MWQTIRTRARRYRSSLGCAAVLSGLMASPVVAQTTGDKAKAAPPVGVIFSAPLPDVPGHRLVVLALPVGPKSNKSSAGPGHRHPGSVYGYVTKGTVRFGVAGQPVQEVPMGGSFFEPPGAVHTVFESASATDAASVIAVQIVPDGAPLVLSTDGAPLLTEEQARAK